jgi:16S rRNA G966 N2-methylase RsmD
VWYMDDGHNEGFRCTLATCFQEKDVNRIMKTLKEKFGLSSIIRSKDKNITIIAIDDTDRFCDLISPHIIDSMCYKLPNKYRLISSKEEAIKPRDFDAEEYGKLSFDDKEKVVAALVRYYHIVGFPYLKFVAKQRRRKFQALCDVNMEINNEIPNGYTQCSDVCLSFFQNIWQAKKASKKSPIEAFRDPEVLAHAIKDCLRLKGKISDSILREELKTFGGVDNFRPSVAKSIINKYCPKGGSVLDPSSGYGGRLMGFYASKASEYYGIDANPDTVKNLKHMRRIMSRDVEEKKVSIHYAAFEDVDIQRSKFDLVFTSPPYFCKEEYCQDDKQSFVRYETYKQWVSLFLHPFICKSIEALKVGGFFVVNIADVVVDRVMFPVANDFLTIVQREYRDFLKFEDKLKMVMRSRYGGSDRYEPFFVFRKI